MVPLGAWPRLERGTASNPNRSPGNSHWLDFSVTLLPMSIILFPAPSCHKHKHTKKAYPHTTRHPRLNRHFLNKRAPYWKAPNTTLANITIAHQTAGARWSVAGRGKRGEGRGRGRGYASPVNSSLMFAPVTNSYSKYSFMMDVSFKWAWCNSVKI